MTKFVDVYIYTVKKKDPFLAAMLPSFPRKKYGLEIKTLIFTANPYFLRGKFGNIAARLREFFTVYIFIS